MEERSSPTTSNHLPSLASSELKMSTTCLELQILFEMEMQLYIVILAEDCVTFQKNASIPITLKSREYEVFTVAPIKKLSGEVSFAPIGLTEMGAIMEVNYEMEKEGSVWRKVQGCGVFGSYSTRRPKRETIDTKEM
ncbi:Raffinose synthase, partial [Cynara cardunculus var. scolymus]